MGIIDLHVHAGPSVMPREFDGAEMYHEAAKNGYTAFMIKDHYFPSMMSAEMINKHLSDGKCRAFGGIALNNSVGGINVKAVDAACANGAKIIWMPTVSSLRHKIMHSGHGLAFPGAKGMSVEEKPICQLEGGKLAAEVIEVLSYMKGCKDIVLATGHGSRDEIDALITKAFEMGVKKILVNHPHYMTGASVDDMVKWSGMGAYIELNAVAFVPESKFHTNDIRECKEIIEAVGLEKIVLDSDYGQKNNGSPVNGLLKFIAMIKETCKLSEQEIKQIVETNPAYLLGI